MGFTENTLASAPDSHKCAFTCNLINSHTVKCMPNITPQMWAMDSTARRLQNQHQIAQSYAANYRQFSLVGPLLSCHRQNQVQERTWTTCYPGWQKPGGTDGLRRLVLTSRRFQISAQPPQFTKKAAFPASHTDKSNMQKPRLWLMLTKCYKVWMEGNMKPCDPDSK